MINKVKSDLSIVPSNERPSIWKISHGRDVITDAQARIFETNNVIVIDKNTKGIGSSKVS